MPILTPQQKTQFEQLSTESQQSAEVLEKRSMRGVKLRVIEKYSESAHFITTHKKNQVSIRNLVLLNEQ